MAVYTDVADDDLRAFIALYDIGEVLSCKGIAEGVENSNFLITTERANFILTLYEKRVAPRDLPFFIALMEHLARHGVACPTPLKGRDGIALRELCGRPAAVVTFLAGMWPRRIQPFHCAAVGGALAALLPDGGAYTKPAVAARRRSIRGWPRNSAPNLRFSRLTGRASCRPESSMPTSFRTMFSFANATCRA